VAKTLPKNCIEWDGNPNNKSPEYSSNIAMYPSSPGKSPEYESTAKRSP
jgi:hypothetical protein